MPSNLENQIKARRKRLADLDQERSELLDQLLRDVSTLVNQNSKSRRKELLHHPTKEVEFEPLNISRNWTAILTRLSGFRTFNASEVGLIVRTLRNEEATDEKRMRPQTLGNIRSQLSLLTKRNIIKRLGGGNYRLTEQTKKVLTAADNKPNLGQSRTTTPAQ
jgi:hypothetical protein